MGDLVKEKKGRGKGLRLLAKTTLSSSLCLEEEMREQKEHFPQNRMHVTLTLHQFHGWILHFSSLSGSMVQDPLTLLFGRDLCMCLISVGHSLL